MDIHAYSQLWMTPWGYTKYPTRDHNELVRKNELIYRGIHWDEGVLPSLSVLLFHVIYLFIFFKAVKKYTKIKKSTWKGIQSVQKFLVFFIIFMYADLCKSCRCAAVTAYSHLERDWSVQPLEWKLRRSSVDVKKAKLLGVTCEKSACFHFANRGNSHKPTSHFNLIRHLRLSWVKSEPF